jgi:uncharacterized protein YyaL (SSP411 family)
MSAPDPAAPHAHTNRLAEETSPYLLQHAHNPVDWYASGPDAFERARREDRPIFLSVGYSTCYWCHVMERQSFENEAIAAEMNSRFVNIKVDREERPDVDQLYMTAVQVLTHQGGWPMSVFLTPDLRPFYGGTYFPPTDQYGRRGFVSILRGIEDAYRNRRTEVQQAADQISDILRQIARPRAPESPVTISYEWVDELVERSVADYEPRYGGFGHAPKFPRQTLLELLLVYLRDRPGEEARKSKILAMLRHTLDALANGGIRDHLGGGFHRYSTDEKWLVPHFEIMLYDNAMLAWVYAEAYRQTADARYANVARGVLDFVLGDMTSPEGAFHTAFDAEVDAQEGLSYLWTLEEVESLLGPEDAKRFAAVYGLDQGPNFADPHHGTGKPDKSILYLARADSALDNPDLARMRKKLYEARLKRKQPLLDTKILTSWNALMVRAMAHGGAVLGEPKYLDTAARAAEFLLREHRTSEGWLYRGSRQGKKKYEGFLDDYSFLTDALLTLHEATADERWREKAESVAALMLDKFADTSAGGFYFTDKDATELIVRQKMGSDSPLPSGNAVAAAAMLKSGNDQAARDTIGAFAGQLLAGAEGMSAMVQTALLYVRGRGKFTVAAGAISDSTNRPLTPQQVAAGVVSLRAEWAMPDRLDLHVSILPGFHINAHDASAGLVATQLSVSGDAAAAVANIDYPPGELQRFAFSDKPIRVYTGDVLIAVTFNQGPARASTRLAFYYQSCDDTACLPPVTKDVDVPPP